MLGKILGSIHLFLGILVSFYAFIISQNRLHDYLFISLLIGMQLLWILFNGECVFSYIYKKYKDKNYTCGDTTAHDDIKDIFDSNYESATLEYFSNTVTFILSLAVCFSVIIVAFRSFSYNPYIIIFSCIFVRFFYLFFNNAAGYDKSLSKFIIGDTYDDLKSIYDKLKLDNLHFEINSSIFIFLITVWMYITYKNRNYLYKVT
jgi:hypothetical protein